MNSKAWLRVVRNSLIGELEYRSNYLILIFATYTISLMELALFRQIYRDREEVQGFPRSAVLSFVVAGSLIRSGYTLWSLVSESVDEIRDGSFRKYLLQPIRYPLYFLARYLGPKLTTWTLIALTFIALKFVPGFEALLPARAVLPFLASYLLTFALTWQLYLCFVYLGFWIEEASFLNMAFNLGVGLLSGSVLPFDWLPDWLREPLRWTPFPVIGDFPLRAAVDLLGPGEFQLYVVKAVAWIVALALIARQLETRGVRRYEAFGG